MSQAENPHGLRRKIGIALIVLAAVSALCVPAAATIAGKINVWVGQSVTQRVTVPIKTVSIADTDVADVVVAGPHEVLINGKKVGFTTLVVWDDTGTSESYNVVVRGPFNDQQIELRVRVGEVNRTKAQERGFDFLLKHDEWTAGSFAGSVATPSVPLHLFDPTNSTTEGVSLALRYLKGGDDLSTMIHALESEGVLRLLAEPNVIASSGQPASFLSGGEIPIPIASTGAQGGATIVIEWKEFGVKVNFVPTIVDSAVINLKVAPEISSLDFANGIVLAGFRVPALRSRKAQTTVELNDGEVLVLGGLIMNEETRSTQRIPILGHIPLIGILFSRVQNTKTETELLLTISAHIVHAMPPGTSVPTPGDGPLYERPKG